MISIRWFLSSRPAIDKPLTGPAAPNARYHAFSSAMLESTSVGSGRAVQVGARVGSHTAGVGRSVAVGVASGGSTAHPAITRAPASRQTILSISEPPTLNDRLRKLFRWLP